MIKSRSDRYVVWSFILPSIMYVVLMVFAPVTYSAALSFCKWSMAGSPKFVLFDNYVSLFSNRRFWDAVVRTLIFSAGALTVEMFLGTAIALLLNRDFRGKFLVRTLFLIPMVATPVSIGLVWMLIYEPSFGIANAVLSGVGFTQVPVWLGSTKTALLAIMIIDIWQWTPMISLIVMAGLAALPAEPLESARVDGASGLQVLTQITLPMVMPTVVVAGMLRLIDVMKTFDIIYATTQGGPSFSSETLNVYTFINAFQYFDVGYASALLIVFFFIVGAASFAFGRLRGKVRFDI